MFGLKNEKLILLIHVVVLFIYKQTYRQTDRQIDFLQMYRSSSIICVLFVHLVDGDCSKIKMIILISYLRAR